jgi:hypothetical protein
LLKRAFCTWNAEELQRKWKEGRKEKLTSDFFIDISFVNLLETSIQYYSGIDSSNCDFFFFFCVYYTKSAEFPINVYVQLVQAREFFMPSGVTHIDFLFI